jgi:hypothetical protein
VLSGVSKVVLKLVNEVRYRVKGLCQPSSLVGGVALVTCQGCLIAVCDTGANISQERTPSMFREELNYLCPEDGIRRLHLLPNYTVSYPRRPYGR